MSDRRTWIADVTLGFRLALADRKSVVRAVFVAAGVGISLVILLGVASIPHAVSSYSERRDAQTAIYAEQPGANGVQAYPIDTSYYGVRVSGMAVVEATATSPTPPGVSTLPGPGEFAVSPALRRLLDSDEGKLLRPRFDGKIVELIGDSGLAGPSQYRFYRGVTTIEADAALNQAPRYIIGWGQSDTGGPRTAVVLLTVIFAGTGAVILVPPLTFVSMAGRLSSGSRDRRLAAMRLAGMSAKQIRRVGAAETLPASLLGIVIGFALYVIGRSFVERITFGNDSLFQSDVLPGVVFGVLAVLLVPVLTMAVAIFGMRGVIVEPLGVVRRSRPRPQRVVWRLCVLAVGLAGFSYLLLNPSEVKRDSGAVLLIASGVIVLLAVPLLLPVLIAWIVGKLPTGQSAGWLLGVRRLQADPGAHSRIVSGVGVTLAGILVLQGMLYWTQTTVTGPSSAAANDNIVVQMPGNAQTLELTTKISDLPGVASASIQTTLALGWSGDGGTPLYASYSDCAAVEKAADVSCTPGDVFKFDLTDPQPLPKAGTALTVMKYNPETDTYVDAGKAAGTMPADIKTVTPNPATNRFSSDIIFTTGSLPLSATEVVAIDGTTVFLTQSGHDPDLIERVRNELLALPSSMVFGGGEDAAPLSAVNQTIETLQGLLIVVAITIILLAVAALVVTAADQISERKGAFAYLAASGVPRSELSKSVVFSAAIPTVVGVALSSIAGVALTWAFIKLTGQTPVLAWGQIGALVGLTLVLVALAVASTLPAVRSATRPDSLPHD